MNKELEYYYYAWITKVVDGDTVHASVDLGMDSWLNVTLRLYGIDAPEMSTPEGVLSKAAVGDWLRSNGIAGPEGEQWRVIVKTIKDKKEKYGRYLAEIYGLTGASSVYSTSSQLNSYMIGHGFAKAYDGGKRVPEATDE